MGQQSSKKITFEEAPPAGRSEKPLSNKLALGAGCYWGTEKYVRVNFQRKFPNSIKSATVGFMSPKETTIKNPTYSQVCSGASGHIEVLFVELNDPQAHFEELIRFFFQFHDPTTKNRQGNDSGFQYASWIFCADEAQAEIANMVLGELQGFINQGMVKAYANRAITTHITELRQFTAADADHQRYLEKNPNGYCNHRVRFQKWPMESATHSDSDPAVEQVRS